MKFVLFITLDLLFLSLIWCNPMFKSQSTSDHSIHTGSLNPKQKFLLRFLLHGAPERHGDQSRKSPPEAVKGGSVKEGSVKEGSAKPAVLSAEEEEANKYWAAYDETQIENKTFSGSPLFKEILDGNNVLLFAMETKRDAKPNNVVGWFPPLKSKNATVGFNKLFETVIDSSEAEDISFVLVFPDISVTSKKYWPDDETKKKMDLILQEARDKFFNFKKWVREKLGEVEMKKLVEMGGTLDNDEFHYKVVNSIHGLTVRYTPGDLEINLEKIHWNDKAASESELAVSPPKGGTN